MQEHHTLFGGRLHIYRRVASSKWQCAAFLQGKNWRKSTKETSLALAKDVAEDWYLTLHGKSRAGVLKIEKKFKEAAEYFLKDCEVLSARTRNPRYMEGMRTRLKCHLLPFFGTMPLPSITESVIDDFRVQRMGLKTDPETGEPVRYAPASVHKDIGTLRMILKSAQRKGWLDRVPDVRSQFDKTSKVGHRGWFSQEEYKDLYTATRDRARNSRPGSEREQAEELHDFVLFMVNTGLRPDEAKRLQRRDVVIGTDEHTGERILDLEVRGKTGIGVCKSMPGAVLPFIRLCKRRKLASTEPLFGKDI